MKTFVLTFAMCCAAGAVCLAGPERISGKEMKEVATAPCPEWYADNEWNVSVWGTYVFTGTEYDRSSIEATDDDNIFGSYDLFVGKDHAWGGGLDAKYFFHRYFGVGIEGFALAGRGSHAVFDHPPDNVEEEFYADHDHMVGGALGTFTLRYPFHCSRFSPYIWAGLGGAFGGYNDRGFTVPTQGGPQSRVANAEENRLMGQFGGGMEVRITRHIGVIGDFSWNVIDGSKNNFGMVRSGLNFAF